MWILLLSSCIPRWWQRWVEPLAWDARGQLHHMWSEGSHLLLGSSPDGGAKWTICNLSQWDDDDGVYYPYLAAGVSLQQPPVLTASWYSGSAVGLRVNIGEIELPARNTLRGSDPCAVCLRRAPAFQTDAFMDGQSQARDTAGEFFPLAPLSKAAGGGVGAVTVIQDERRGRWGFSFWRVQRDRMGA